MVVASKNSIRTSPIYLSCVYLEQRKMSHFSFSLSHTLTMFLSIFQTAPPAEALSFLCLLSLKLSPKWPRRALCFSSAHNKAEWPLLSFFFCCVSFNMSHTPKSLPKEMAADFGALLIKRSQTFPCIWSLLIK